MNNTTITTVAVIGLVMLAGCSALPQGVSSFTNEYPFEEAPDGFSTEGVTDVDAAIAGHTNATADTKFWIVSYSGNTTTDGQNFSMQYERHVSYLTGKESRTVDWSTKDTVYSYHNDTGGYYYDTGRNDSKSYMFEDSVYNASESMEVPLLSMYLSSVNYTYSHSETKTVWGFENNRSVPVAVYTADDQTPDSTFVPNGSVENLSSTIAVAEDGRITRAEFDAAFVTAEGVSKDVTVHIEFDGYYAPTVKDPFWIGLERNQSD